MRDNYHRFAAHILVGFTQFACGLQVADGFHQFSPSSSTEAADAPDVSGSDVLGGSGPASTDHGQGTSVAR